MVSTRVALFTLITLFSASRLFSQAQPRVEIFGGYSYFHRLSSTSEGINGAEGTASWNLNHRLAADFDVSGYHRSFDSVSGSIFFYLAGPRLNFGPFFVHGLVGGSLTTTNVRGASASENNLGAAFGGGYQRKIVKNISFRTSADYMLTNYGSSIQHNARVSVGLVFSFGSVTHR